MKMAINLFFSVKSDIAENWRMIFSKIRQNETHTEKRKTILLMPNFLFTFIRKPCIFLRARQQRNN